MRHHSFNASAKGGVFDAAKELATRTTIPIGRRSLEGDSGAGKAAIQGHSPHADRLLNRPRSAAANPVSPKESANDLTRPSHHLDEGRSTIRRNELMGFAAAHILFDNLLDFTRWHVCPVTFRRQCIGFD
jgi:hypothetical protein